jgi:hypothetical protein
MKFNLTFLEILVSSLVCLFIFIWTNHGRKIRRWLQDYFRQRRGPRNLKAKSPEDCPFCNKHICLPLIVRKWPLPGKLPSLTNRLRRLLDNEHVSVRDWYHPLAQHLVQTFAGKEVRLVIDCTKVGFNHRLMTIGIAYKKRTLPLVWSVHKGRKGHVAVTEQLKLFRYVATILPRGSQVWVMGDAGFESVPLLRWLRGQGWSFVIRQNGRTMVRWVGQEWVKLNQLAVREGQTRSIGWVRLTRRHDVG